MTRDYAKRAHRTQTVERNPGTPAWVWIFSGFLAGIVTAAAVFVLIQPKLIKPQPVTPGQAPPAAETKAREPEGEEPGLLPKPRFDFYTILPQFEVVIPEREIAGETSTPQTTTPSVEPQPGARYFLQAGSFRRYQQADEMKARLALAGLMAGIETVTINDNETWHRVRLGPYADLNEIRRIRSRLEQNAISTIMVREK